MSLRGHAHLRSHLLGDEDGVVAEGLSKAYHAVTERIFEPPTPVLTRALRGRRPAGLAQETQEDDDLMDDTALDEDEEIETELEMEEEAVWALRDVSFRVGRGSSTALVGGSRSGKTTLLRILAGSLPPTTGHAALAGRPGPLINLGVHLMVPTVSPERNVIFAAALAGAGKRRVKPHLDAIFELAGVSLRERRQGYTASMYKLAVAAAIELGTEVLLLDDPFASASQSFRQQIIDRVAQRHAEGTTVIIETRDRDAIRQLCDGGIWLHEGVVARTGGIVDVFAAHDASAAVSSEAGPHPEPVTGFNETAAIVAASADADPDGRVRVALRLELSRAAVTIQAGVGLAGDDGTGYWFEQPDPVVCELPGFHRFEVAAHDVPPGRYTGLVQARVLEGGAQAIISRRNAFVTDVGAPRDGEPARGETAWEPRDASWLYEPEQTGL